MYILNKPFCLWFTGLSGSGKTTLSNRLKNDLKIKGVNIEILDGDEIRKLYINKLGFTREDRLKNIEFIIDRVTWLETKGVNTIVSTISPYSEMRDLARKRITSFLEVYINCSIEKCIQRDPKGLYQKALNLEIKNFTGISDPYETPESPDVEINTDLLTIEESSNFVIDKLIEKGYIILVDNVKDNCYI